jgi:hypothetical protein
VKLKAIEDLEGSNRGGLHIVKEGMFCRAYNRSTYLFVLHLQAVKIIKKYYKVVQREMILVGVPDGRFFELMAPLPAGIEKEEVEKNRFLLRGFEWEEEIYKTWFAAQALFVPQEKIKNAVKETSVLENELKTYKGIIEQLKAFPLLHSNPLEAQ